MGFGRDDRVFWDFWTVEHAGLTWLYALSAPRLPEPEARHDRARIDLLTSPDLRHWTARGTALEPGPAGAWDDLSLWTGSLAVDPAGGFAMLYTGRCRAEDGRVQRIGLARSDDLVVWRKHPAPVLEADPALYRTAGRNGATSWRDPWLEWSAADGHWRAWITAQHPYGPVETAGTIALAESADLVTWRVGPPVVAERLTEHLEVPQRIGGGAGLLVNVYAHHVPEGGRLPQACLSMLFRSGADGHYAFDRIVEAWPSDSRYIIKEVRPGVGLCFEGRLAGGPFLGRISDPFPFAPLQPPP